MAFTTAAPPPAGIYWQAAIFTGFKLAIDPVLTMKLVPDVAFVLAITPKLVMLPPLHFTLLISPILKIIAGTEQSTSFRLQLTPTLHWIPSTTFKLSLTPVLTINAKPVRRGRQINTAVTRAATR